MDRAWGRQASPQAHRGTQHPSPRLPLQGGGTEGADRLYGGLLHLCGNGSGLSARRAPHTAKHDGNFSAGGARIASHSCSCTPPENGRWASVLPALATAPHAPHAPLHACASPCRRLPSSSSSAVIDLERRVRVVLGALLGGGGAERKRDGILHFLSRNLRGVARCRCHFFSTAWISSYSRDEESHCCRILLRLRVEANFFMVSVAQSRGTGQAPARRGWWLPEARARCPGSHSPQQRRVQVMSPGCACPPAATGDAMAMKASCELNLSGSWLPACGTQQTALMAASPPHTPWVEGRREKQVQQA